MLVREFFRLAVIVAGLSSSLPPVQARSKPELYKVANGQEGEAHEKNVMLTRPKRDSHSKQMQFLYRNPRDVDCHVNCTNSKHRPVCGTDGRTYQHKCEVKRLRRCEGKRVKVHSRGRCSKGGISVGVGGSKCLEERKQALELASKPSAGIYIPECKPDGTFAEVQCHKATNYCWCVTETGKPIPGSSVRGKKINCRGTKGCSPTDRSTFNGNLIKLFSQEFDRIPRPSPPAYPGAPRGLPIQSGSDSLLDTPEKRVIEWKFTELDLNKDNRLRKKEIRSLKRMVKKLVKPKACAKTFDRYCDLDQDGYIARTEWSVCLGVDINNEQATTPRSDETPPRGGIPLNNYADVSVLLRSPHADAFEDDDATPSLWDKQHAIRIGKTRLSPSEGRHKLTEAPPVKRDCDEEKRVAEDMDRMDPEGRIFIPECVGEGHYRPEQCHKSTGYCWCVDETTGKPIPGTSTHNVLPDCNPEARPREFKGCPYTKKKKFQVELMDQLTKEMMDYAQNDSRHMPEPNPEHSFEEGVVRWKLRVLDRNSNQILERREWKVFKNQIQKKKSLRRCGRNFIRYCDVDEDKKVTLDEWIDCMGMNEQQKSLPHNNKRKGPNPFSKYLRS